MVSLKKKQAGMIILTTVIMISILTILILSLMQSVFFYTKVSNHVVKRHHALYQFEAAAYHLIALSGSAECLLTEENPNQLVDLLLQKKGCLLTAEHRRYYYLVDDLGLYPCLQSASGDSSHHWLYTIFSPFDHAVIQLRVARPASVLHCELSGVRHIKMGVISWRYLTSLPLIT